MNVSLDPNPGSITGVISGPATPGTTTLNLYLNNIFVSTTLDTGMAYSFLNLAPGSYVVTASSPGFQTQSKGAIVLSGSVTYVNFNLDPNPGTLVGTVSKSDGITPLENAIIKVLSQNILIAETTTNAAGAYSIAGLSPGSYVVIASHAFYSQNSQGAIISAGQTTTANFSLLEGPGILKGYVYDNQGAALASCLVEINQNNIPIMTTLTGIDGSYTFGTVAPGSYIIHAHDTGYQSGLQGVTIVSDTTKNVDFYLNPNPGSLAGVVSAGSPLSGVLVEVNYNNVVIFTTLTASDGAYLIEGIAPGSYIIHAHNPSYQSGVEAVTISSDTVKTLNFALDSNPATISGYVYDYDDLAPIAGGFLLLYQKNNGQNIYLDTQVSTASGYYIFEGLSAQNDLIVVKAGGYFPDESDILIPSTTKDFYLKKFSSGPQDLRGEVKFNTFLLQRDRIHEISWKKSQSPRVVAYNVYKNKVFAKQILKGEPYVYIQHDCPTTKAIVYKVQTVFDDGFLGGYAEISLR